MPHYELPDDDSRETTNALLRILIHITERLIIMSETLQQEMNDGLADLSTKVEALTTADASALIQGLSAQLAAAIAGAAANGVTEDQLAQFTALRTTLDAKTVELANAVVSNTPTPPAPTPVSPPPVSPPPADTTSGSNATDTISGSNADDSLTASAKK